MQIAAVDERHSQQRPAIRAKDDDLALLTQPQNLPTKVSNVVVLPSARVAVAQQRSAGRKIRDRR
jgi:hypothetical protein